MAPQLGNYVLETATAPGTGSFTLNGPETDRRSFSAAFPNGGSVFYFADDGSSAEWGVGTLTIGTPSTLSRTTIIGTTSGGTSALNFPGSVEVYNEIPAEYVPVLEQDGSLTLAGSLTVKGNPVVLGIGTNRILQATIDSNTGSPSFMDGGGGWHQVQPYGSYATTAQLNAEIQRATNIESNLQSSKFDKAGGVISGGVTVSGSAGIIANYDPGGQTVGQFMNYAGIYSVAGGRGGKFGFYVQEHVGTGFNGVIVVTYPSGQGYRTIGVAQGSKLSDSLFGELAYASDLQNYALLSQLPLDPSKIVLAWSGYVGGGDQSIPYPRGVSSVDTVVVACSRQVSGNKATVVINVQGWDNSSVQVNTVWVGGSSQGNSDTNYRAILVGNK